MVYAEIGSSFAINLAGGPNQAAHFIGQLLKALGPKNVIWGTDSIWWGSPQWLIDAFNTLMAERKRHLSLADVLRQSRETHERLLALVEMVPADQIATETRFRRRLRLDTYSHYPEHTKAIQHWREQRSAG